MSFVITRAVTPEEKRAARSLVGTEYAKQGYVQPGYDFSDAKIRTFLDLPDTLTLLSHEGTTLVGTISLVTDSAAGLPMEELYPEEIGQLRAHEERLAEVTQFAVSSDEDTLPHQGLLKKSFAITLPLFRHIHQTALKQGVTTLCITINPKHDLLYSSLGFETFGTLKQYPTLTQAPAIAKKLDLRTSGRRNLLLREIMRPLP